MRREIVCKPIDYSTVNFFFYDGVWRCPFCKNPRLASEFFHTHPEAGETSYCKSCWLGWVGHIGFEKFKGYKKAEIPFDPEMEERILQLKFGAEMTVCSVMVEHSNKMGAARLQ